MLIAAGLALLLIMLRLEAARFSAAEYDDTVDGHAPSVRRRIAWYAIGLVLVAAIFIVHPTPGDDFALGAGDRPKTILYGFLYAAIGTATALGIAFYRYCRLRFPDVWSYPGALLNAVVTAIVDEVAFRGAVLGILLVTGLDPTAANVIQALLYALATRLGAPGRNRWLLVMALLIGLVGGWVTAVTGGIAAAFLGHAVTRFAVFLSTGHAGQFLPRGREVEEIEAKRRPPQGWRVIGPREPASRDRRGRRARRDRRRPRRQAPAHGRRSGSTSISRSASRSARTATSSWSPGLRRAGRRTGSRPTSLRCAGSWSCARTLWTRRSARPDRRIVPRSTRSTSAAGRRHCSLPTMSPSSSPSSDAGSASRRTPR
jgi:membrane protease YdiL (CAAX protease family)